MNNLLLKSDLYKYGHHAQYPEGTNKIYSYFTARGSRIKGIDKVKFFGLRYFIEEYLTQAILKNDIDEFRYFVETSLGKSAVSKKIVADLQYIVDVGYLPIEIKALPEMEEYPLQTPLFTITNTEPRFYWLVNFLETLLMKVAFPTTVATISAELRRTSEWFASKTCDDNGHCAYQNHDFSYRSHHSEESACLAGAAHLLSFDGTDTMGAIELLAKYYGIHKGVSVSATEHSVMCMYGEEGEFDCYNRLLDIYPEGILSIVSDTYDYFRVLTDYLPRLKERIMARNGKVVIRPDSSPKTPLEIVCGDPEAPYGSPEQRGTLELLGETFGYTINSKGYKVLNPHIGLIYGDGISPEMGRKILEMMAWKKWASSNIVFGVGGYTYSYVTRDTFGFAIKATYGEVNGVPRQVYKNPKTDSKKRSAKGLLYVGQHDDGTFYYEEGVTPEREQQGLLQTVYRDGALFY